MGQYHLIVNLGKKEYLDPHKRGDGLKLVEQFTGRTSALLLALLSCSNGRGGGDIQSDDHDWIGRWAGDRIAIVGDYAEAEDLMSVDGAEDIYGRCRDENSQWREITEEVIKALGAEWSWVRAEVE
jgi:hypothetical protein